MSLSEYIKPFFEALPTGGKVYGEDTVQMRSNVRSQLDQLKKRGLAHGVAPGKWVATPKTEEPSE